jgi:hypothetical protein
LCRRPTYLLSFAQCVSKLEINICPAHVVKRVLLLLFEDEQRKRVNSYSRRQFPRAKVPCLPNRTNLILCTHGIVAIIPKLPRRAVPYTWIQMHATPYTEAHVVTIEQNRMNMIAFKTIRKTVASHIDWARVGILLRRDELRATRLRYNLFAQRQKSLKKYIYRK